VTDVSVGVLVVFYSRYGQTEQLALAAGLGAIQARANVRLRRVADLADAATIRADAEWARNLERMNMDYVVPRPADPPWADVIVLVTPAGSSAELERYVRSLRSLGSMANKIAAPLVSGPGESALTPIYASAAHAGLMVVPPPSDGGDAISNARAHGRRVTQMARALKNAGA
jgi:NAD(P)H dehydrogenase (quinone)